MENVIEITVISKVVPARSLCQFGESVWKVPKYTCITYFAWHGLLNITYVPYIPWLPSRHLCILGLPLGFSVPLSGSELRESRLHAPLGGNPPVSACLPPTTSKSIDVENDLILKETGLGGTHCPSLKIIFHQFPSLSIIFFTMFHHFSWFFITIHHFVPFLTLGGSLLERIESFLEITGSTSILFESIAQPRQQCLCQGGYKGFFTATAMSLSICGTITLAIWIGWRMNIDFDLYRGGKPGKVFNELFVWNSCSPTALLPCDKMLRVNIPIRWFWERTILRAEVQLGVWHLFCCQEWRAHCISLKRFGLLVWRCVKEGLWIHFHEWKATLTWRCCRGQWQDGKIIGLKGPFWWSCIQNKELSSLHAAPLKAQSPRRA